MAFWGFIDRYRLFLILILAFALRIIGIHFGLPDITHADEPMAIHHAVAYASGDFNPHYFKLPPLLSYALFFFYGIYFVLGTLFGVFHSLSEFEYLFLTDPSSFYLIGRIIFGAFFGAATVYLVYLYSFKLWGDKTISTLSCLFLALSFLHVRNSHYVYHDIPMTFFVLLTLFFLHLLYQTKEKKYYLWAGLCGGIAAGFKYNAALISLPIVVAHLLSKNKATFKTLFLNKHIYLSAGVMIGTYLLTNPFSVIDYEKFLGDFMAQVGAEEALSIGFHLKHSLAQGMGLSLLICSLLGLGLIGIRNKREGIVFISFPIIFYLFCVYVSQPHSRYMIPLIPFLAISAAYFLRYVSSLKILKKNDRRVYGLAVLVILPTFIKTLYIDTLFLKRDTRSQAREWIEKTIPSGAKIALDHTFFDPKLRHSLKQLSEKLGDAHSSLQKKRIQILLEESRKNPSYEIYYVVFGGDKNDTFLFSRPVIKNSWREIKKMGIQYIVVHRREKSDLPFYVELDFYAKRLKTFSPYRDTQKIYSQDLTVNTAAPFLSEEVYSRNRLGYTIDIYKVL